MDTVVDNSQTSSNDLELERALAELNGQQTSNEVANPPVAAPTDDTPTAALPPTDAANDFSQMDSVSVEPNFRDYIETPPVKETEFAAMPDMEVGTENEPTDAEADTSSTISTFRDGEGGKSSDLEDVKVNALRELRPLVDRLDLAPNEKFDIYFLIIKSTGDKTLMEPAYEAARQIEDEGKRAKALLDIIQEIDSLGR